MTERPEAGTRPRKPRPLPTVLAALAVFGVAFEFLAFQLSSGRDPAVGAVAAGQPHPITRPAKKLIITKVIPASGGTAGGSTSNYSSSGSVAAPAPVTTSSS